MNTKSDYPLEKWDKAKEEMREILIETAKSRRTITYKELTEKIQTIDLTPRSPALNTMLEETSREEDKAGRGMLTVVVIHESGDVLPGSGFFKVAKELGRDTSDIRKCWEEELGKVFDFVFLK